jgi:hypothetical protein
MPAIQVIPEGNIIISFETKQRLHPCFSDASSFLRTKTSHVTVFLDNPCWILMSYLLFLYVHIECWRGNYCWRLAFRIRNGDRTLTALFWSLCHKPHLHWNQTKIIDILFLQGKIIHAQDAYALMEVVIESIRCASSLEYLRKELIDRMMQSFLSKFV